MKAGAKVVVEQHRFAGVYIAKGTGADALVTKNLVPGEAVYGEKRITVEVRRQSGWARRGAAP